MRKAPPPRQAKLPKSGKQRKAEIKKNRGKQAERRLRPQPDPRDVPEGFATAICVESNLAPNGSYGRADFVYRGYYIAKAFRCKDCDKKEVWTATQQKWWYEVAKGDMFTMAIRCRNCRRKERERITEARRVQQEGMAKKLARKAAQKGPA